MKNLVALTLVFASFASYAATTPANNGNSNLTVGDTNATASASGGDSSAMVGNLTATGGAGGNSSTGAITNSNANTQTANGGAGGAGGNATTGPISNSLSNQNNVSNRNSLSNSQSATGGAGGIGQGGNASTGPMSNTQTANGGAASTANANNASQQTSVNYVASRIPATTAYAAPIHPTAVCALSLSGGAQGALFGLSLGGSYIDENCRLLEQVRAARAIGAENVAIEMMMDVPAFAKAVQRIADRK